MMNTRLAHYLLGLLLLTGCLGDPKDPRPLPRDQLDGSLFDARRPQQQPSSGSGYGSGSGSGSGSRSVQANEPDAPMDDTIFDAGGPFDGGLLDVDVDAED